LCHHQDVDLLQNLGSKSVLPSPGINAHEEQLILTVADWSLIQSHLGRNEWLAF